MPPLFFGEGLEARCLRYITVFFKAGSFVFRGRQFDNKVFRRKIGGDLHIDRDIFRVRVLRGVS